MKNVAKYSCALLSAAIVVSCATVPLTGRRQLNLVNEAEIQQQAALAYSDLLSDSKTKVIKSSSQAQMVQRVGKNIAGAVNRFLQENGYGNQYEFHWEFNLIEEGQINAGWTPGVEGAVYTGNLPLTKNEAGSTTVMGHETAHATAQHSAERMSHSIVAQAGGVAVDVATPERSNTHRAVLITAYGLG